MLPSIRGDGGIPCLQAYYPTLTRDSEAARESRQILASSRERYLSYAGIGGRTKSGIS